jgi:hypothetical protein
MPGLCALRTYQRRQPHVSPLYRAFEAHLETFLTGAAGDERGAAGLRLAGTPGLPPLWGAGTRMSARALRPLWRRHGRGLQQGPRLLPFVWRPAYE